jgi:hypothetical protein
LSRLGGSLPHRLSRDVDAGIYGLVLGSSIVAAASVEHPDSPGVVEAYLCITALVFFLAHVYARVIGAWIEGQAPSVRSVRRELGREWPMVSAQLLPVLALLLGALRVLPAATAITVALALALSALFGTVGFACWQARATRAQTALSLLVATAFAAAIVGLKIFVHG